jgi:hypothetical protein
MKRIINGKAYNTETARRLGDVECHYASRSDFGWHDTGVYMTKKGAFFVAGRGGPSSCWAHYNGNTYRSGEGIQVISKDNAREYLEADERNIAVIEELFEIEEA